jgi:hypothetical protein
MGRSRLASSDIVRLSLSDGDFLTVRKELNAGEGLDLEAAPFPRTLPVILAYLVGWSFVDAANRPIPYSLMQSIDERRDTLRNLDTATMDEIIEALAVHLRANRQAIEEKKTTPEPALAS